MAQNSPYLGSKSSFINRIPGFRTGVWWKRSIAFAAYLYVLSTLLAILVVYFFKILKYKIIAQTAS